MKPEDRSKQKYYVVTFPTSKRKKPRIVHGWKAVLSLQQKERILFRGFHTKYAAEKYQEDLRALLGKNRSVKDARS